MKERYIADFHSHTTISDGKSTPKEMVKEAVKRGIDILAITDHNQIDGYTEAREYVDKKNLPIILVPGVEVTTDKWHLLGLNISPEEIKYFLNNHKDGKFDLKTSIAWINDHQSSSIAVIPHPDPFECHIQAASFSEIEDNQQNITGIEINNGELIRNPMFGPIRILIEACENFGLRDFLPKKVKKKLKAYQAIPEMFHKKFNLYNFWNTATKELSEKLSLFKFSNSDAHKDKHIGRFANQIKFSESITRSEIVEIFNSQKLPFSTTLQEILSQSKIKSVEYDKKDGKFKEV